MKEINITKLKELREKASLTQEDVSSYLGYKTGLGYHYIEKGRTNLKADQVIALASLYGVTPDEFFCTLGTTKTVGRYGA